MLKSAHLGVYYLYLDVKGLICMSTGIKKWSEKKCNIVFKFQVFRIIFISWAQKTTCDYYLTTFIYVLDRK